MIFFLCCPSALAYIPDDPDFICAEYYLPYSDHEKNDSYIPFAPMILEQYAFYGFAPYASSNTAVYRDDERYGEPQVSGSSIDLAWDIEKGDPSVVLAIIDTGAVWSDRELIERYFINKNELPPPDENQPDRWDINGDGVFNVMDYRAFFFKKDKLVRDPNGNGRLDPQDLILTFSDGIDDDENGFTDDICGWDFFEDDNDPEDTSSYSIALNHGFLMMRLAGAQMDKGIQQDKAMLRAGVCPDCMILPLKDWDSFLVDTNHFAAATYYAQIVGASTVGGARAGLFNTGSCKDAFKYVYDRGLPLFIGCSDINSANHNYPTHLDEAVYCSGILPDSGMIPYLKPTTYFRDSNTSQYGAKNQISFEVMTASESSAMAAGAGGILLSYAVKNGIELHSDQVKQLLTLTSEDVLPENTGTVGNPDPAKEGWDQHFGYGRVNLEKALKELREGNIPPVARILFPKWFTPYNFSMSEMTVTGDVLPYGEGSSSWTLEIGYGVEPDEFIEISKGSETGENITFAVVSREEIENAFPKGFDFSYCPRKPEDKNYGDAFVQPNRFMFTLRLKVTDEKLGTYGEDRRTCYLHDDKSLHEGWPKCIGVGGEASLRFSDLDGDNLKEVIIPTSDGRILIYTHDGKPYKYQNEEITFYADYSDLSLNHDFVEKGIAFRHNFTSLAVGDMDHDGIKEIVGAAGSKLYCFTAMGKNKFSPIDFSENFKKDLSLGLVTHKNPIGPGAMGAPLLLDMDKDGDLEIILGAYDQRVYAWHHDGTSVEGWPVYTRTGTLGGKIIHSPSIADLDGDGTFEIIVTTNEIDYKSLFSKDSSDRSQISKALKKMKGKKIPYEIMPFALDYINKQIGRNCLVYAIHPEGTMHDGNPDGKNGRKTDEDAFVDGWPVKIKAFLPEILPHLVPSNKPCAFDYTGDGTDEVVVSFTTAKTTIIEGNGNIIKEMDQAPFGDGAVGIKDNSIAFNALDSLAIGDITGDGIPEIAKGGITLLTLLNFVMPGQNFPYDHVVQVWNTRTGNYLDAYPRTIDDWMVFSDPAIADVSGDGIPEVVIGSGLYLLHAFGEDGNDKEGFPKFTGGWIEATPTIGDIDGDGTNEVAAVTREGWVFVWDTEGIHPKTIDWPSTGHDNFNTSNANTDAIPPASVTDMTMEGGTITFTCPGDDEFSGYASRIRIYGSDDPITVDNFKEAETLLEVTPGKGGATMTVDITPETPYILFVAMDDEGNISQVPLENPDVLYGPLNDNKKITPTDSEYYMNASDSSSGSCFINALPF